MKKKKEYINVEALAKLMEKTTDQMRDILVRRKVLRHNANKKRYELTKEAHERGLGVVKKHYICNGEYAPHYLLDEFEIRQFLLTMEILPSTPTLKREKSKRPIGSKKKNPTKGSTKQQSTINSEAQSSDKYNPYTVDQAVENLKEVVKQINHDQVPVPEIEDMPFETYPTYDQQSLDDYLLYVQDCKLKRQEEPIQSINGNDTYTQEEKDMLYYEYRQHQIRAEHENRLMKYL